MKNGGVTAAAVLLLLLYVKNYSRQIVVSPPFLQSSILYNIKQQAYFYVYFRQASKVQIIIGIKLKETLYIIIPNLI